jgi:hypothetical protein
MAHFSTRRATFAHAKTPLPAYLPVPGSGPAALCCEVRRESPMTIPATGKPEDRARANIDRLLTGAGWVPAARCRLPRPPACEWPTSG